MGSHGIISNLGIVSDVSNYTATVVADPGERICAKFKKFELDEQQKLELLDDMQQPTVRKVYSYGSQLNEDFITSKNVLIVLFYAEKKSVSNSWIIEYEAKKSFDL